MSNKGGKRKTILILLVIVLFLGVMTNPSQDEFVNWYLSRHPDSDGLTGLLGDRMLTGRVERDNYIVFSVYRMEGSKFEAMTLAILGQFFKLNWRFTE